MTQAEQTYLGEHTDSALPGGHLGADVKDLNAAEDMRSALLAKVDARVGLRAGEMWTKAQQMVSQMEQKHNESTNRLLEEVARCRERQRVLEAENDSLRRGVESLCARCSLLGEVLQTKESNAAFAMAVTTAKESAVAPPATPPQVRGPAELPSPRHVALLGCEGGPAAGLALDPCGAVPPFPLTSQTRPPPGTPLSLADALGAEAPLPPTPAALPEAVPPPPPGVLVAPCILGEFGFASAKADEAGAWPEAVLGDWGGQWACGAPAEQAMFCEQFGCLTEFLKQQPALVEDYSNLEQPAELLQAEANVAGRPTTLRADACVFVPRSAELALP